MLNFLLALIVFIVTAQAESSISTVVQSKTASPEIAVAPSLTPTFRDPQAPNPQKCPGYKATNIERDLKGVKADLTIAGLNCQAFGNDIRELVLEVQYQTKERLNVKIFPKYLSEQNRTQYILPDSLVFEPGRDEKTTISNSDLRFEFTNSPSFQFKVTRSCDREVLFSTYGHVIVFEDQFVELVTSMEPDYNVYGLAENIHDFHLGQNFTQTFWTNDAGIEHGNPIDGNIYGVHPFYQESRYHKGSNTTSHGVYARNAHGQEWLLRPETLTYRTIGGSIDLYFLSGQNTEGGSTAIETMRQYHTGCVGLPAMQMFWTLGFHQCRLGYDTLDKIEAVVENYRAADIPLEAIWSDFDMFDGFRSFANNPVTFPPDRMAKWVDWLHENEQYYVPLVWANIYRPNPDDPKDTYGPYERGAKLKAFIRDPESGDFYTGNNWPGFVVWGDFMLPETHKWWAGELKIWYDSVPYDGMLSDLTEPASYCGRSLMVSGIGPEETLKRFDIPVLSNLPGVGQGTHDSAAVHGPIWEIEGISTGGWKQPSKMKEAITEFNQHKKGPLTNGGVDVGAFEKIPLANLSKKAQEDLAQYPDDWPEVEFIMQMVDPPAGATGKNYAAMTIRMVGTVSRGNMTISSASNLDPPVIDPNWLRADTDKEVALYALRRARQLWEHIPSKIGKEIYPGANITSDEHLLDLTYDNLDPTHHGTASCSMGKAGDSSAVVDSKGRVFGIKNLRVIDSSTMPLTPPGHTMGPTYGNAEKLVQDILNAYHGLE